MLNRRHESVTRTPVAQDRVQRQKMSSTQTTERLSVHGRKEHFVPKRDIALYRNVSIFCHKVARSHPLTNILTTFSTTAISHMRNI
jgi:hypothetical protein